MDIWKWSAADYNGVLKEVEKWLKRVLATTDFDVETVELKGRCPVVVWGEDYKRQVKHFTWAGSPRCRAMDEIRRMEGDDEA